MTRFITLGFNLCLPGEYDIVVDNSVNPVQNRLRKVAYALKDDMQKKITALEEQRMIAKMDVPTSLNIQLLSDSQIKWHGAGMHRSDRSQQSHPAKPFSITHHRGSFA